ncbi:imidazoleglycerol-phosphate dehydratase HisB [Parafannyhessea umbonata]|jgi:imidazoleglycerol-phosphate dehydratase|uniref:imidazoleglycerol-phosphate dehydratase HisB n=1 Tax=Parafannyhessea TaxID=2847312 RepID=UPI001569CDC8|nr:imidazoleglycerol-phosphate dehydratase HisB [Parafannyhessea umbonata]MCI6681677.1 imidazoleglycerol-phosphate dehydratase HisB [Parafannyhessea umbonata]MCI7219453.1 imidazoleglycerol-phosphate dehydratase HisB [Parafannyhessea umbonata]MDD7199264.1 imidazoleglycerol-phosphate dehydratase HisB [Parafannyhessea umbonata]MDY4014923.1 imidazoleglycerol-phosphate dehydratase HisB [Parafannyhessea umbonata]MDY4419109.1 imidazoleglycerol-phosphate dehydratase HisB [Parafannyhessea umbonata]
MARSATVTRKTGETDITVTLDLDGTGVCDISTGVGFFDHMLSALGRHSLCDLTVHATGDTWVDDHHTVEDVGIVLGQALAQALGDKSGITRFSDVTVPMDEALVLAAIDVSGRGELYWDVPIAAQKVGTFDTELGHEFFQGFARDAGITLHVREIAGENAHHILECAFKAVARAIRGAVEIDPRVQGVPSTKGSL